MSSTHKEKFLSKMLIGFALTSVGIFSILFAAFERSRKDDWFLWGFVASVFINTGLYLLVSAFVHKVKSDLIKRQKQREQQKTFTAD
jgi:uncharacterized membrane protein HdeD (DUF308 family)